MATEHLIINDPIYGFMRIPRGLLCEIIRHPFFQRLDRIRQLGMAGIVYPGATHTRKQHSIGACHLAGEAFRTLAEKGIFIFDSEIEATEAALLMHDLGHAPYSHVLEKELLPGISHEDISLLMMQRINRDLRGELALAISIFKNEYPKLFLRQLICSQLDMDRLDYLCRDSFYTGVREGTIGAERLIKMLQVENDCLAVDAKGIYTVENYLMARRLMYWQVYLHKTAVAGEETLRLALRRAKELSMTGVKLFASPALNHFLNQNITIKEFENHASHLDMYAQLDDSDILCAMKVWQYSDDLILSILAGNFINRRFFKVEVCTGGVDEERIWNYKQDIVKRLGISMAEADYFVRTVAVEKEMYNTTSQGIRLLYPDGDVRELASVSNIVRSETIEAVEQKFYLLKLRLE